MHAYFFLNLTMRPIWLLRVYPVKPLAQGRGDWNRNNNINPENIDVEICLIIILLDHTGGLVDDKDETESGS
jgi:hypothetical protein